MKIKYMWGILLVSLCTLFLVACGENVDEAVNESYAISYIESSYYNISGLPEEATSGDEITFTISFVNPYGYFYQIDEVSYNGNVITASSNKYSFTMIDEDVTISVSITEVGEYTSGNISFSNSAPSTIRVATESDKSSILSANQSLEVEFGSGASFLITSVKSTIYSSNTDVIPLDALTYSNTTQSASTLIIGGKLTINLKLINEGETYIYLNLSPNNGSLGTIVKKITVIDGEIEVATMEVNFTYTNSSKYDDSEIFLSIEDVDYVYGQTSPRYTTVYLSDVEDKAFTFTYVIGHTYHIYVGYTGDNSNLSLGDWMGLGSSLTGYNQLISGELSLLNNLDTVELIIKN